MAEPEFRSLDRARAAAAGCRRCPLYKNATQTVFGEGPAAASLMLLGEQPGDQEDRSGRPFVGPAGRVLDDALAEAGIGRDQAYLTNAVKHFKNTPRGKRRIHQKPTSGEVEACKWWLDSEISLVRPRLVVALGGTAARALLGRPVVIAHIRGKITELRQGMDGLVTVHPSFILRQRDDASRAREYRLLIKDLSAVARHMAALRKAG